MALKWRERDSITSEFNLFKSSDISTKIGRTSTGARDPFGRLHLFPAALESCCPISISRSLLRVLRSCPVILWPCGFHCKACLAMLLSFLHNVRPSQLHFRLLICFYSSYNWKAPWKNRISSTTMKLRKSLVKPVTRQKTCHYIELFGSSARDRHARRISCYSLNVSRYMRRRAWRSRVEEPNNTL